MNEKEVKSSKDPNICCHWCRISRLHKRKSNCPFLSCTGCAKTFCKPCLEGQLHVDWEAISSETAWVCPCCNNKCCCSYTECLTDHIHCFTYKRTVKSYIQTAKWLKKKDPPPATVVTEAGTGAEAGNSEAKTKKDKKTEKKAEKKEKKEKKSDPEVLSEDDPPPKAKKEKVTPIREIKPRETKVALKSTKVETPPPKPPRDALPGPKITREVRESTAKQTRETPKLIREAPLSDEDDPDLSPPPFKKPKKRLWTPLFTPGDIVLARWKTSQEYYQGTITKINYDSKTYCLTFEDGDLEQSQTESTIRLIERPLPGSAKLFIPAPAPAPVPPVVVPKMVHAPRVVHQAPTPRVFQPQPPQPKFIVEPILDIEPSHPVLISPVARIRFLQFSIPTNGEIQRTSDY